MPDHSADEPHLQHALELAREGVGRASPNPCVGAVIADDSGNVAGSGTYTYAGVKHAEILALETAGARARGGTLYINLEPHAHRGRTPPCTDALIAAGIRRVVASMPDPNPKVSGRGFEQLRAAGVQVEVGGLAEPARRLNEAFARYIRSGIPFVTLKSAMSLDGKIAPSMRADAPDREPTAGFSGQWITGEAARAHVHQLRHQNDAILVGIGTVLADNPLLTDRSGLPRRCPLLRVILDSDLRLPIDSQLVQSVASERKEDVLVFTSSTDADKQVRLEQKGVRIHKVPRTQRNGLALPAILNCLGEMEVTSLLIEGGSAVNGSALEAKIVDKVFLYYAPKILGDPNAVSFTSRLPPWRTEVENVRLHRIGEDFAVEGYLRDPYA